MNPIPSPEKVLLLRLDRSPDDAIADDDDQEGDGVGNNHEIFLRQGLGSGNGDEVAATHAAIEPERSKLKRDWDQCDQ